MEFELKKLSKAAIPAALGRAERYRLLNEPALAESICQDILVVEPDNRQAIALLILALSDQFIENIVDNLDHAWSLLSRLNDEYLQAYYQGILFERQARVYMRRAAPGSHFSHGGDDFFVDPIPARIPNIGTQRRPGRQSSPVLFPPAAGFFYVGRFPY